MSIFKSGDYGYSDTPLGLGGKYSTGIMRCHANTRIQGTIYANRAGKVRIYQGATEADCDDYVTEITFAACALPGDGEAWTVECVGLFCRIEVENDSGFAMATMRFGWKLHSYKGVSR
jgi:hypothetical protein